LIESIVGAGLSILFALHADGRDVLEIALRRIERIALFKTADELAHRCPIDGGRSPSSRRRRLLPSIEQGLKALDGANVEIVIRNRELPGSARRGRIAELDEVGTRNAVECISSFLLFQVAFVCVREQQFYTTHVVVEGKEEPTAHRPMPVVISHPVESLHGHRSGDWHSKPGIRISCPDSEQPGHS